MCLSRSLISQFAAEAAADSVAGTGAGAENGAGTRAQAEAGFASPRVENFRYFFKVYGRLRFRGFAGKRARSKKKPDYIILLLFWLAASAENREPSPENFMANTPIFVGSHYPGESLARK